MRSLFCLLPILILLACNSRKEESNKKISSFNKFLETYPNEIDSLIQNSLSKDYDNEFKIDTIIVSHSSVWTGEKWEIDGARYTVQIKVNNVDVWVLSLRRSDLFIVGKNKITQ